MLFKTAFSHRGRESFIGALQAAASKQEHHCRLFGYHTSCRADETDLVLHRMVASQMADDARAIADAQLAPQSLPLNRITPEVIQVESIRQHQCVIVAVAQGTMLRARLMRDVNEPLRCAR